MATRLPSLGRFHSGFVTAVADQSRSRGSVGACDDRRTMTDAHDSVLDDAETSDTPATDASAFPVSGAPGGSDIGFDLSAYADDSDDDDKYYADRRMFLILQQHDLSQALEDVLNISNAL